VKGFRIGKVMGHAVELGAELGQVMPNDEAQMTKEMTNDEIRNQLPGSSVPWSLGLRASFVIRTS